MAVFRTEAGLGSCGEGRPLSKVSLVLVALVFREKWPWGDREMGLRVLLECLRRWAKRGVWRIQFRTLCLGTPALVFGHSTFGHEQSSLPIKMTFTTCSYP